MPIWDEKEILLIVYVKYFVDMGRMARPPSPNLKFLPTSRVN